MTALLLSVAALVDMAVRLYAGHGPLRASWVTIAVILTIAIN